MNKSSKSNNNSNNLPSTYVIKAGDINYIMPALFPGGDKRTFTSIKNACDEIIADEFGQIYINTTYLDRFLRVKNYVAKEILLNIPREDKVMYDGKVYITLPELTKQINKRLETLPISKTRNYLMLVELFLINIREHEKFQCLRTAADTQIMLELKKLKNKRKKKYSIVNDELTGLKLRKGAQFSHIRAKSVYPSVALDIDNGLIINQDIHEIITSKSICDEDALYELCLINNWDTKWYTIFKNMCT